MQYKRDLLITMPEKALASDYSARDLRQPETRPPVRQNLNRLQLAMLCLLLSLFTGCAWPVYRGNPGRTGRSGIDTSSNQGIQQWAFFTGQSPQDSVYGPVIGIPSPTTGGIYVGDLGGILYSVNPAGTLVWKISLPVLNSASPNAIGVDGTVYVADNFGSLYAVRSSGTLEWSFPIPFGLSPAEVATSTDCTPAAGCQTTIYTGNHCGVFYALDSGGNVKWTFSAVQRTCRLDTPTISPAIASDGTIYSGLVFSEAPGTGVLFSLNSNGTLRWSSQQFVGTPAIDPNSGIIYVVSLDRLHLYALNSQGVLQWQFDSPQPLTLPAIASDGTIYVGTGGSGFWALNPNGTTKWQTSPSDPNTGLSFSDFDSPPIIGGDGTIYVVAAPDALLAINPDSTVKWDADPCIGGGGGQSSGGVSPNEPVIGTDGTIYVQDPLPSDDLTACPLEAFH